MVRGARAQPTKLGEALYRHGLQLDLLESELAVTLLGGTPHAATVSVAVNADSLATWMNPALTEFSRTNGQALEVLADDQDHTSHWLKTGRVLGAVTTQAQAVQGCRVIPLGVMVYRATASPAFMKQRFPKGPVAAAFRAAPVLAYDRRDLLHEQFVKDLGMRYQSPPTHYLPSPESIVKACLGGVGWSVNPEPLVAHHIARHKLVELSPGRSVKVPLYWQCWSMSSHTLDTLTDVLKRHAAEELSSSG